MLIWSLFLKKSSCFKIPKQSSTTEINKHTLSGYTLFTHCSFNLTKKNPEFYSGKDCMESFCKDLKEHATKLISYEKRRNNIIN